LTFRQIFASNVSLYTIEHMKYHVLLVRPHWKPNVVSTISLIENVRVRTEHV